MIRHHSAATTFHTTLADRIGTRLPLAPEGGWRDQANCIDVPVDMFFPSHGVAWATKLDMVAEYCNPCPVADQCHQYGLTQDDGIYGHRLVRQAGRTVAVKPLKSCGTNAGYARHRSRGETPCKACYRAKREDTARRRAS